jgi:HD-like signal output (HDOD) protein
MAFAMQQMKNERSLQSIAKPLADLWEESIAVASICQVLARRTKVSPDETFLTGLLHGIGRLYIMVRAVEKPGDFNQRESFIELVSGWHASIGKAVLENWGFAQEMSDAIGDQRERDRKRAHEANLTDILIIGVVLARAMKMPVPRVVEMEGVDAFAIVGLSTADCIAILTHAEYQLGSLHDALGC